uniref:RxLR23-2 n=1 Tax=Phytophthora capsici TaxID=4784 RepID=A0A7T1AGY4_PHYCP|nr:RxLR23-2 [Phytophthora capsici]
MRLHYIVVLAVIAFATNGNEVSAGKSRVAITTTGALDTPTTRLLRTQYTDEERAFGLNLLPGSKKISSIITNKKLSKYLKSNQEFDDVFIRLKLDKAGDKLFENPKFLAWAQYVDDFNQKHQTQNSMLPTLVRQFGGDDLSIMLEKAKQADKTYGVALRLQGEQMKLWRREGLTTDMLFKIYKLDDGATNLLENPGIKIWMRYADELFPGDSTLLFKKLQKTYSDEALSKILINGKTVASTEKLASDLQNQQLRYWLKDLVPPEKAFQLLSLNKGADDVFGSPQLQTWIRYNAAYAKQNPYAHKATLIDTLLENFDTAAMVKMLKTRPNTAYGKHLAGGVERDLIKRWVTDGKPLKFVVENLGSSSPAKKEFVTGLYNKYKAAA